MYFESREYTPDDYEMVCGWWEQWGKKPLPDTHMSKTGVIVSSCGVDLCCAWLYKTDSAFCIMDWFISNKDAPKLLKTGSVSFLVKEIEAKAKDYGFSTIFTSVRNQHLKNALVECGFDDENKDLYMTNYIKGIYHG